MLFLLPLWITEQYYVWLPIQGRNDSSYMDWVKYKKSGSCEELFINNKLFVKLTTYFLFDFSP